MAVHSNCVAAKKSFAKRSFSRFSLGSVKDSARKLTNSSTVEKISLSPKHSQGLSFVATRPQLNREARLGCAQRIEKLVKSDGFEAFYGLAILAFTVSTALESQHQGTKIGHEIQYYEGAFISWPYAGDSFEVLEWVFGILFAIELALKIIGLRKSFCSEYWNWIDAIIVGGWVVQTASFMKIPLDQNILRVCRLIRLARLLKLVRTMKEFDALYVMTTAMGGSISVLLWTVVLLVLVQTMIALILQYLVESYILNQENPAEAREEVFKFYGTFARTMLTMFEITLGNYMPPCRALVENVSEWYLIFSLTHKLIIGFSVVAVITGVFIQETFKVATTDDRIMLMQRERAARTHTRKMKQLFQSADASGDGALDLAEFKAVMGMPGVQTWLSAMELDVRDADSLFQLIDDDGDGQLTAEELIKGAGRLKGAARSIDVAMMWRQQHAQFTTILSKLSKTQGERHSNKVSRCTPPTMLVR